MNSGTFASNIEDAEDVSVLENIVVHWSDSDNIYEDGTLFMVEFLIAENSEVGSSATVTLQCEQIFDDLLIDVTPNISQGSVKVIEYAEEDIASEIWTYYINDAYIEFTNGTIAENIPVNGDFNLIVDIESAYTDFTPATVIVATYGDNGCLISLKPETITQDKLTSGDGTIYIDASTTNIKSLKLFIWEPLAKMKPLSEMATIFNTTE